jgi:hypothetical protein
MKIKLKNSAIKKVTLPPLLGVIPSLICIVPKNLLISKGTLPAATRERTEGLRCRRILPLVAFAVFLVIVPPPFLDSAGTVFYALVR